MFTVEGIEVLGTPIGNEGYIKNFVAQNCVKIMRDIEKIEPLTDVLTHFQLIQKTMNSSILQYKLSSEVLWNTS